MSLNVEGLSMPKCEYLSRLFMKHDVDVLHLQKTHLRKEEAPSRYEISNYTLVENLNHEQYGIATYAKSPEPIILVNSEKKRNYFSHPYSIRKPDNHQRV